MPAKEMRALQGHWMHVCFSSSWNNDLKWINIGELLPLFRFVCGICASYMYLSCVSYILCCVCDLVSCNLGDKNGGPFQKLNLGLFHANLCC